MTIQETYNALVSGSISGVKNFTSVPSQVNTAQLPCKYVKYGSTSFAVATLTNGLGLPSHSFEIVFLIEPIGQSNNILNQSAVMTIAENIYDYLDAILDVLSVESTNQVMLINGISYWSIVVSITFLGDQ